MPKNAPWARLTCPVYPMMRFMDVAAMAQMQHMIKIWRINLLVTKKGMVKAKMINRRTISFLVGKSLAAVSIILPQIVR
jgi:hypothetical protein